MKKSLLVSLSLVGLSLFNAASAMAQGPSRSQTIRAAQKLSDTAYDLSRFARQHRYYNTSRELGNIAVAADQVERAARRNNLPAAENAVNRVEDTWIAMRQFINNIPYASHRLWIKRSMRRSIDNLGDVVFGSMWVAAAAAPASSSGAPVALSEEDMLDSQRYGMPTGRSFSDSDSDLGGGFGGGSVGGGFSD